MSVVASHVEEAVEGLGGGSVLISCGQPQGSFGSLDEVGVDDWRASCGRKGYVPVVNSIIVSAAKKGYGDAEKKGRRGRLRVEKKT